MFNELFKKSTYKLLIIFMNKPIKSFIKDIANIFAFTMVYCLFDLNKSKLYMIYSKVAPIIIITMTIFLILALLFLHSRTINLNNEENTENLKLNVSIGIIVSFCIYFKIVYLCMIMMALSTLLH